MKFGKLALGAAILALGACNTQDKVDTGKLKDPNKKASYAIGVAMAKDIQANVQNIAGRDKDLDTMLIYAAFREYIATGKMHLDSAEIQTTLMEWQKNLMEKQNKANEEAAATNKKAGAEYLSKQMSANANLKRTGSGLVYEVLKEGSGARPTAAQQVSVHYKGTLIDGTTFDESKGEPVTFGVTQVIPGWTEGLQLMTPGSKYKFIIPSELAYGDQERPPHIKPGSTLVFEVELVSVK